MEGPLPGIHHFRQRSVADRVVSFRREIIFSLFLHPVAVRVTHLLLYKRST
jgi:hypothetical protein